MKKVAICVTNDLVADQRVNKVASTLSNNNFDITLIGRKLKNSLQVNRKYKTTRFKLLFNKGFLFYANYNIRLFFYLLFSDFDIILANDLDSLTACYYAAKIKKKQIVYDSHELFTEVPELINRKFVKNFWTKIEKHILPKLKNTYTVCRSIANIYNKKYGTNFCVVRNIPVCNNNKNITKNNSDKKIIIYQGAVNIGRGLKEIINAMQFIDNAILLIIGDGDILQDLKKIVTTKKLSNKIEFKGKIPFDKLKEITQTADLGISLEQNLGLNYYYALPNKIFDYIHSGIPVLASDLPEIRNIIKKYNVGELVNDFSTEALSTKINNLLNNDEKLNIYKQNTKLAAKELCWQTEEKNILKIFNNI